MRFNTAEYWKNRVRKMECKYEWHNWFAWRPVIFDDTIVWWENIQRRRVVDITYESLWEYRDTPDDVKVEP